MPLNEDEQRWEKRRRRAKTKVGLMNLTTHNIHARQNRRGVGSTSWRKLSKSMGIIRPVQMTLESGDGRRVKSTQRQPKARKAENVLQKVLRKTKKAL